MKFINLLKLILPTEVKVGQVWTYTIKKDNPFEPIVINYQTVLEIRNGWVKYHIVDINGLSYSCSSTCKISYFKIGSKLIKDV